MDIKQKLISEHSKKCTLEIVAFIVADPGRFGELLKIFLGDDKVLSQRAAWPLSNLGLAFKEEIISVLPSLLKKMHEPGAHDAVKRNVLRLLQDIEVPEKYQAPVVDTCFRFMSDPSAAVAVRAFAITVAANICKHYPELGEELRIILNEIASLPHTAALSVRIKKALKDLRAA